MNSTIERLLSLRVVDVMRPEVVTLSPEATMTSAAKAFVDHKISGAPVTDDRHCVGILSAADFVRREMHRGVSCNGDRPLDEDQVSGYMTRSVQSIAGDASLIEAARTMCRAHVHRLPVMNASGKLIGMASSLDIVAAMVKAVEE
jgi:CBS domain-containing protein